jgi:hypothetical protein
MVFTGDGWGYRFPPCRASPRIGSYFLGDRTFPALYRPPWFVKKKRLPGITEQLFRRTAKPLKQKQVIPLFQFKVLYLQQIIFFRMFFGQAFNTEDL